MDELVLEVNQMEKPFHLGRGGGQRETSFSITYPASLLPGCPWKGLQCAGFPKEKQRGPEAGARGLVIFLGQRIWSPKELTSLLLSASLMIRDTCIPAGTMTSSLGPLSITPTLILGSGETVRCGRSSGSWSGGYPGKGDVFRKESLWMLWNESPSWYLWTDWGFLFCHLPTVSHGGVPLCIPLTHL